jgi:hypothetical protein
MGERLSPVDAADLDGLVDPFQGQLARVGQPEADRTQRIHCRAGDQDLLARRGGANASGDVHATAPVIADPAVVSAV